MAQAAGSNSVLTGHSCTGSQAVTIRTGDTGSETWISATRGKLLHVRVCIDTIPCMNVHVHACALITSRMCSYTESLICNLHIIHVCRLGGVVLVLLLFLLQIQHYCFMGQSTVYWWILASRSLRLQQKLPEKPPPPLLCIVATPNRLLRCSVLSQKS